MIQAMVQLLGNFYASNDLANFEAIARSLNSSVPGESVSSLFIGLVYYRRGQIKNAIGLFDQAANRPPLTRNTNSGNSSHRVRDNDSLAITSFIEAAQNDPNLAQVWYDLGSALQDVGNNEGAARAFQTAVRVKPEFTEALIGSGAAALAAGNLILAKESFSRLLSQQPNNEKAYLGLGLVYRKLRDFASAHACFTRARLLMNGSQGIDGLSKSKNRFTVRSENLPAFSGSNPALS